MRTIRELERGRVREPHPESVRLLADALDLRGETRARFEALSRYAADPPLPAGAPHAQGHTQDRAVTPDASPAPDTGRAPNPAAADPPTADPPTSDPPTSDPPSAARPAPAPAPHRPAQLPADVYGFAGRDAELAQLDALLDRIAQQPTAVPTAVVSGTAGVGKTALAVHWAHRVADRFEDGQLYVNLRGFGPSGLAVSPATVVRGFLDAFEVPPERVPVGLDAQAALYRSLLAGRRVLVVLDNARDTEQVRTLLPGAPRCAVVVTSRNQLTGLVTCGAGAVPLDLLRPVEARRMLAYRVGEDRVAAEPAAVEQIVARCARLPLALSIVAARAATHPGFPLATLAAELRETQGRRTALGGTEPESDLYTVFSWSYRALGPDAARLFRLLHVHPGPDLTAVAAASLAGIPVDVAGRLLGELAAAHLVGEHAPGRYGCHDLLREYAAQLSVRCDTEADRRAALHRTLDHYLHTAHAAALLVYPDRQPIAPPDPDAAIALPPLDGYQQALAWFSAEHRVLLAAVDLSVTGESPGHTWRLASTLVEYLDRRGHWRDLAATQRAALDAAVRAGDVAGQAVAHRYLGRGYARLGRDDDARTHYQRALDLFTELGDQVAQGHAHLDVGWICERRERHAEASRHAEQALDGFRAAGHLAGQARALNNLGWSCALLGDYRRTLVYCEQARVLHLQLDNRHGLAAAWDSLGYAHRNLGAYRRAIACYQYALAARRRLGDRYFEAATLTHLAETYDAAADHVAGRRAWQQALAIMEELSHPDAERIRGILDRFPVSPAVKAAARP